MLILMQPDASAKQTAAVLALAEGADLRPYLSTSYGRRVIALISEDERLADSLRALPGVAEVKPLGGGAKLSTRLFRSADSIVRVGGANGAQEVYMGGGSCVIIAGPCSVEGEESLLECARAVRAAGASMLRGGAFKPRTSPYGFQGLGVRGLEMLARARQETGLPVVTEALSIDNLAHVAQFADMIQIGARNMQNFPLLRAAGETGRPVLLKRGMMATIDELLMAAEYVLATGNESVVLCERGIRTFEQSTRNTLDVAAVPVLRKRSHLPIIIDPSHAAGLRDLVPALALAGIAAGADGLIIEVHPDPDHALTDAAQTVGTDQFADLMARIHAVRVAISSTTPEKLGG